MSKVADYLQDHLAGDVYVADQARAAFSNDASILTSTPQVVVAVKNEQDVRKVARFSWQLAERGRALPIVSRGAGTDMSGAAIGQALSLAFTPYLNHIIEFDDKKNIVTLEPGVTFGTLQHMLSFSHGRYVPAYPSSYQYSTIGGAVANNAGGERSLRFGPIGNYVQSLKVVLSNGDVIETKRLSKRELNKKMGEATFEGELYRSIDALLIDKEHAIKDMFVGSRSNAGYNIQAVREKDGSLDLTPLFVGSQGTLGLITEMTLSTESYNPSTSCFMLVLHDLSLLEKVNEVLSKLKLLSCEFYDSSVLELARRSNGGLLTGEVGEKVPPMIILAETDAQSDRQEKKFLSKLQKQINDQSVQFAIISEDGEKEVASRLKRLPHILMGRRFEGKHLVPGIDDASVPVSALTAFLTDVKQLFAEQHIDAMLHGHALEGVVHAYPLVDLTQLGDRQKILRLIDAYYEIVLRHGGSVSAEHGEGRIRSSLLQQQVGDVMFDVMKQIKQIFDPYNILNPGVKFGTDQKSLSALVRQSYDLAQLYKH